MFVCVCCFSFLRVKLYLCAVVVVLEHIFVSFCLNAWQLDFVRRFGRVGAWNYGHLGVVSAGAGFEFVPSRFRDGASKSRDKKQRGQNDGIRV